MLFRLVLPTILNVLVSTVCLAQVSSLVIPGRIERFQKQNTFLSSFRSISWVKTIAKRLDIFSKKSIMSAAIFTDINFPVSGKARSNSKIVWISKVIVVAIFDLKVSFTLLLNLLNVSTSSWRIPKWIFLVLIFLAWRSLTIFVYIEIIIKKTATITRKIVAAISRWSMYLNLSSTAIRKSVGINNEKKQQTPMLKTTLRSVTISWYLKQNLTAIKRSIERNRIKAIDAK